MKQFIDKMYNDVDGTKEYKDAKANMTQRIQVTNPYSGQSAKLSHSEYKLYHEIKDAEVNEDYTTMQKKLDKFSRLNVSAYMTLLD